MFAEIGHHANISACVVNTLLTALERVLEIATFLKMEERQVLITAMSTALAALDTTGYPVLNDTSTD